MADNFSIAHKFTRTWEGGESDDAADSGGFTKFGVSTAFLTDIASTQAGRDVLNSMGVILPVTRNTIRNLTESLAASLFRWQMWPRTGCIRGPGLPSGKCWRRCPPRIARP